MMQLLYIQCCLNFSDSVQKAQMYLLDHMSRFQPALPVNRVGYRALVSVQLRQPKTDRERDWASLQSKAWPPWKQDRNGLDADKDMHYGTSRARRAISRSVEDGYAPRDWELASGILAGWDTDNSPTIQTRGAPPSMKVSKAETLENNQAPKDQDAKDGVLVWAARIRATRTLDEAWAGFQSYSSQASQWDLSVWFEMYKKLVYARISKEKPYVSRNGTGPASAVTQVTPGDDFLFCRQSSCSFAFTNPKEHSPGPRSANR